MSRKHFGKYARANTPPNLDNIIPAEPQPTRDKIIISTGDFFNKIGQHDITFCMFMSFIDRLRASIDKNQILDIDCPHKKNHAICPYLQGKLPPMRLKRLSVITDRVIAQAMDLKPREFYYLKEKMVDKLGDLYRQLSTKKLHTDQKY